MKDDLSRRYDTILRELDPHLEMRVLPADTAKDDRAVTHWIVYNAGTFHPSVTTLEAQLGGSLKSPGPWLKDALAKMQWWIKVSMARRWQSFTPAEAQRQNLLAA